MLLFENKSFKAVLEEVRDNRCHLLFVKDEGIYMMSETGEYKDGRREHVAYAYGFDPRDPENDDWYDAAAIEVGHDDFGEYLGEDFWGTFWDKVVNQGGDIFLDVSEGHIRAGVIEK